MKNLTIKRPSRVVACLDLRHPLREIVYMLAPLDNRALRNLDYNRALRSLDYKPLYAINFKWRN